MKAALPTERVVQRQILAMLRTCFPTVIRHHSPNGAHLAGGASSRFKQIGALKGDGMLVGFPDLALYWNHGHALIEVKRPGAANRTTPDQKAVHALLAEAGWPVRVVTSADEVYEYLLERGAPCKVQLRAA